MKSRASILCAVLLTSGCARRTAYAPRVQPQRPAAQAAIQQQVKNAVLAGEGDQQVRILRQRLAIAPQANDVRLELAAKYLASGFPDLALEHVRLARANDPANAGLARREAQLLLAMDLPGEAASALQSFVDSHPAPAAATQSLLAVSLDEAGRLPQGEAAHRAALKLSPSDDALHNNLGFNLLTQRRFSEAAVEFEAALRLNQHSDTARANLARTLAERPQSPDVSKALAHWTSAADAPAAHNNLAAVFMEQGQYDKARQELNLSLSYRRDFAPALRNLELVSQLDGRPAEFRGKPSSRFRRIASAVKRAFVDSEQQPSGSGGSTPRIAASH